MSSETTGQTTAVKTEEAAAAAAAGPPAGKGEWKVRGNKSNVFPYCGL